jgi:drug/metabolite transporter (DMT)-like permease
MLKLHDFCNRALLAIASGAVASGLGYAIWYRAIRNLRATTAASVQLTVPALATVGGIVFLNEPLSGRTIVSVSLTIVGIGIVLLMREKAVK